MPCYPSHPRILHLSPVLTINRPQECHGSRISRRRADQEKKRHQRHRHQHSRWPESISRGTLLIVPSLRHTTLVAEEIHDHLRDVGLVWLEAI